MEQKPVSDSVPSDKPNKDYRLCETCGDPIVRQPGQMGRLPRNHPGCKPSKKSSTTSRRSGGRTKGEEEAELLAEKFRKKMNEAAVLVGVFDPFDGFAIVVQSRPMSESVQSILSHYDGLRASLLAETSGPVGVFGLIFASLCIALPIMAHHRIIPAEIGGKPIGKYLEGLPKLVKKFQDAAAEAEDELAQKLAQEEDDKSDSE